MHKMEREVNQVLWDSIFTEPYDYGRNGNDFENDTFTVKSYDWSDERDNDWHFYHKPSGFKISWYKYPLRSPMCNMKISNAQFLAVLRDCYNSLKTGVSYSIEKWWSKTATWVPAPDIGDCCYRCSNCNAVHDAYSLEDNSVCKGCGSRMEIIGIR